MRVRVKACCSDKVIAKNGTLKKSQRVLHIMCSYGLC